MSSPVDEDDLTGDELVGKEKKHRLNILFRSSDSAQKIALTILLDQFGLFTPFGQDDAGGYSVDPDIRSQLDAQNTGQILQEAFAEMVGQVPSVVIHHPGIQNIENGLGPGEPGKLSRERKGSIGVQTEYGFRLVPLQGIKIGNRIGSGGVYHNLRRNLRSLPLPGILHRKELSDDEEGNLH